MRGVLGVSVHPVRVRGHSHTTRCPAFSKVEDINTREDIPELSIPECGQNEYIGFEAVPFRLGFHRSTQREGRTESGPQEIRTLFIPLVKLRRAARRHGRQPVQGLRPGPAVHQVCQRQVRGPCPTRPSPSRQGASFKDMVALKGKSDIGDQINKKIIAPLANANKLSDMPDFNDADKLGSGKEMVDRLTNLIAIFENPALDFSKNRADGDDILGDAYEYLMRHFATESGKSKGQFYTPAEVSRIMAQDHRHPRRRTTTQPPRSTTRPAAPDRCC